ncbi:MAG: hypothetical protein M9947_19140 [Thermomicrobiales bacterium]|nr:hypothetical protein [Thermomicrobiales bacterium]
MRKVAASLAILTLTGSVAMAGRTSSAQDAASTLHPLVGVWEMRVDLGEGDTNCPAQLAFSPTGSVIDVDCEGVVAVGVWEPTGDRTANLTITSYNPDYGRYLIRAAIEVAADGASYSASFTFELIDEATGNGTGQFGPGTTTATRQNAEGPGTPEGTISDMLTQGAGSVEATPVA